MNGLMMRRMTVSTRRAPGKKMCFFHRPYANKNTSSPIGDTCFKLSRSEEWCPCQFWMEVIAFRFGMIIGVEVPPAWPAVSNKYISGEKTYGALIEWFYDEKQLFYFDGGQFFDGTC